MALVLYTHALLTSSIDWLRTFPSGCKSNSEWSKIASQVSIHIQREITQVGSVSLLPLVLLPLVDSWFINSRIVSDSGQVNLVLAQCKIGMNTSLLIAHCFLGATTASLILFLCTAADDQIVCVYGITDKIIRRARSRHSKHNEKSSGWKRSFTLPPVLLAKIDALS